MSYFYAEDADHDMGPRLWDAGEGVCCAAYQLGACAHTEAAAEAWYEELLAEEAGPVVPVACPPVAPDDDEPF
jgi:hypothetical protein